MTTQQPNRLVDFSWSVATNVTSALLAEVVIYLVGELSGANNRLFDDKECSDFSSQPQAQEALRQDPEDPYRLDLDGDGKACETLPGG